MSHAVGHTVACISPISITRCMARVRLCPTPRGRELNNKKNNFYLFAQYPLNLDPCDKKNHDSKSATGQVV